MEQLHFITKLLDIKDPNIQILDIINKDTHKEIIAKLEKTDFYRSEHQKRKDEICPFSSLAFLQPTTVDKEPEKSLV
ncbi:hypothetical protein [Streptococcus pneumoniae]|uniref:hypothetical protein n=1 Tax=Streptococcus pneumoniae TaxID=1313 RepID=UPI00102481BA|nr:hypothetical protein [Streptococcus pneumoniae]VFI24150.1 IS1181 transposase [Streptococcus pneumoniae]